MLRELLLEKGWRRHSIIFCGDSGFEEIVDQLPPEFSEILSRKDALAIISTYDCAVINPCLESEPWVQLLLAFPEKHEKRLANCRDPRRLHFSLQANGEDTNYETNASCICQIHRSTLAKLSPNQDFHIDDGNKHELKNWIAERYRQDTWPDSFVRSIRPIEKRLKKFWKKHNNYISAMYIKLDTYDEKEGEKYVVQVLLAIEEGKQRSLLSHLKDNNKQLASKNIDEVMSSLEVEVINIFDETVALQVDRTTLHGKAVSAMDESNITVAQLRHYSRLSPYSLSEFLSTAALPVEMVPGKA